MQSKAFQFIYRVPYSDCTVGNHIYYSRYLDILEAARGEFFRHIGMQLSQWQEQGIIFPVIECRVRYHAPARYDDVLTVELNPVVEGIRLKFQALVKNQTGAKIIEAETTHVCAGLDEKPRRVPEELAGMLGL